MNAAPMLRSVIEAVADARLEVILIGNAGAALLGARVTTTDFDFMIRRTPGSIRKLRTVTRTLEGALFQPFYPISRMYRFERDDGLQIDFLMYVAGIHSFEGLRARAERLDFDGGWSVVVASLPDIIKSKRATNRPKDRAVLPELEATQREREAAGI